jgi:hypothetical protein
MTASAPSLVLEHGEVGTGEINSRRLLEGKTFIFLRATYLSMRVPLLCAVLLLLLVGGAAAAETSRYSYLSVERVAINLSGPEATVVADYRIDPGIRPLVAIFGRGDLHQKVRHVLGFEDARVVELSLDRAVLVVDGASMDYGEGSYWFPSHTFSVLVPSLTVSSPQETRQFTSTDTFPRGIGYFGPSATTAAA